MKPKYHLRLFVAGESANSIKALSNIRAICAEISGLDFELEVIDVLADPARALAEGVLITPALLRVAPNPIRKVFGNLSDRALVVQALGISSD